ncbi:MAG TPA: ATP-binding protein [Desulfobaccales bacterium]|nr:ATP-binding protein [Desulfobaccales bacterium]
MPDRLLVVDDEPNMLRLLKTILMDKTGYEVTTTNNPLEVSKLLQESHYDFFTTKETGKGTGLGLSMSYGIITKFGGNIIFSSYPADEYPDKHGTTFTVYLPTISGPEAEANGLVQAPPNQTAVIS